MSTLPIIVAHRGASHDAPENTMAAFVLAWMQGADAIEGDFRMTKDRRIVCMHDETTGRTTNRNMVVARATFESLRQLDAGGRMAREWIGQHIPTLEEVLACIPAGRRLFLEVKAGVEMLAPLKEVLDESPENSRRVTLIAFDPSILAAARKLLPGYQMLLLVNRKRSTRKPCSWSPSTQEMLEGAASANASGVSCCAVGILHDPGCAAQFEAAGMPLHAWKVHLPALAAKLRAQGVVSITTDRPGWIRQGLLKRL